MYEKIARLLGYGMKTYKKHVTYELDEGPTIRTETLLITNKAGEE